MKALFSSSLILLASVSSFAAEGAKDPLELVATGHSVCIGTNLQSIEEAGSLLQSMSAAAEGAGVTLAVGSPGTAPLALCPILSRHSAATHELVLLRSKRISTSYGSFEECRADLTVALDAIAKAGKAVIATVISDLGYQGSALQMQCMVEAVVLRDKK